MSVRSKTLFGVMALLLIGGLVLGGFATAAQAARSEAGSAQTATPALAAPGTITVVGRGEVKVKPDVANTNIGVEVQAPTVDAAMEEAQARMNAVLDALEGLGIATKDIQTSNFSINFERLPTEPPAPAAQTTPPATPGAFQPPAGFYRVSNMVQVTIRDLTDVGNVLDTAVKAGANNIWGISFGLDDTDALEAQAREAAVEDARARAESLAQLNGVEVGDVLAISEVIGNVPVVMQDMGRGGGGTPVEPGEVTFTTQIQVVYAIAK